jgi:hypothetical protein
VSGRLAYKPYESLLEQSFKCVALLHDPYYELAERLISLQHIPKFGDALMGQRDLMTYQPLIAFAASLGSSDASLRKAFAAMPREAIPLLTDPLTRQLAAESIDVAAPRGAFASALNHLSAFSLVGLRTRPAVFIEDFEAMLGMRKGTLPVPNLLSAVRTMARRLKATPEVELLLENDLSLYERVASAIAAAHAPP